MTMMLMTWILSPREVRSFKSVLFQSLNQLYKSNFAILLCLISCNIISLTGQVGSRYNKIYSSSSSSSESEEEEEEEEEEVVEKKTEVDLQPKG